MWKMCIKTEENIEFRFDGKNEIDAEELSLFLNETVNMFKTIININDKDIIMSLKINTFEQGSFKINATTVIDLGNKLFQKIKNAKEIVEAFKSLIEIKDLLKGKKPEEIKKDEKQIILSNGKIINNGNILVLNILDNDEKIKVIDKAINKFTKSIPKNRNLDITDKKGTFTIDNKKKENLIKEFEKENTDEFEEIENSERRSLIIKKPDLNLKSQWEFISDKIIKANILDNDFKEKVLQREFVVYHNQKIEVLLKTKILINKNSEIIETHYEVIKVYLEEEDKQLKF